MRSIVAILKLIAMALASLLTAPIQYLLLIFVKGKSSYIVPTIWHTLIAKSLGLKFNLIGQPAHNQQVFFVGNHLSHFDIFILGSLLKASFVAKEEIAKWPLIGFLSRLQQTAFISRSSGQASQASNSIRSMIDQGKSIILFPEGTSTRGETVLDFKSSLFSLPLEYASKGLKIQPFTFRLLTVDGKPADTQYLQDLYAWDRDNPIDIGSHIWNFAQTKGAQVDIIFHPVITIDPAEDRKILARRVQEIVAAPLEQNPAAV